MSIIRQALELTQADLTERIRLATDKLYTLRSEFNELDRARYMPLPAPNAEGVTDLTQLQAQMRRHTIVKKEIEELEAKREALSKDKRVCIDFLRRQDVQDIIKSLEP